MSDCSTEKIGFVNASSIEAATNKELWQTAELCLRTLIVRFASDYGNHIAVNRLNYALDSIHAQPVKASLAKNSATEA